jgi:hypothetical protein
MHAFYICVNRFISKSYLWGQLALAPLVSHSCLALQSRPYAQTDSYLNQVSQTWLFIHDQVMGPFALCALYTRYEELSHTCAVYGGGDLSIPRRLTGDDYTLFECMYALCL